MRTLPQGVDQETASGVAAPTTESEQYAAVKTASEGLGTDPERGQGLGDSMWAELASGFLSDDVPGQSQRIRQGEARQHAESVDTGGIQVRQVRHEKVRSMNPADIMTKPMPRLKIEQLVNIMGDEFMGSETKVSKCPVPAGTDLRCQVTMPPTARHSQSTCCTNQLLVTRPTRSQVRQCRYVVRWQAHLCVTWSVSRGSEDTSLGRQETVCLFRWQQRGELEAQTPIVVVTELLDGQCRLE